MIKLDDIPNDLLVFFPNVNLSLGDRLDTHSLKKKITASEANNFHYKRTSIAYSLIAMTLFQKLFSFQSTGRQGDGKIHWKNKKILSRGRKCIKSPQLLMVQGSKTLITLVHTQKDHSITTPNTIIHLYITSQKI